jgi:hypothetical protein
MSAAVLFALPSGCRAGAANNSLAFFPFAVRLRLAGEQPGRAGKAERHQQLEDRHIGPAWKFPGPAPVVGILPGHAELDAEGGISAQGINDLRD